MERNRISIITLMILLLHSGTIVPTASYSIIHTLITEFLQNNIAAPPKAHQKTEWNFDPEVGKQRSVRYEQENGRFGEYAIAKLGMGIGYEGPWGKLKS